MSNHKENRRSSSENRSFVWVRTEVVEAVLENGGEGLPPRWKPSRKRSRNGETWGWCRAFTVSRSSHSNHVNNNEQEQAMPNSPFGQVKLRKTKKSLSSASSPWKSPQRKSSMMEPVTVTVDDDDFAPNHLDGLTVTLTPDREGLVTVLVANSWWSSGYEDVPTDLCTLTHLHEPAVVFCLRERYYMNAIYTYTGKILLALNPFRMLPDLYGQETMQLYWKAEGEGMTRPPPHIYAVAQDAYTSMIRGMQIPSVEKDQSILVSGESGAGKTVTTKIIMRYLTTLSRRHQSSSSSTTESEENSIESQVLQSNPILESFGNARTVRNDNSSRFGKFIEIRFTESGSLFSASIDTYLLEKVRLISQAPGERNYHVFYELLAGTSRHERKSFCLGNLRPRDFNMLAHSGTFDRRDGVEDRATFQDLRQALDTVGFGEEEQHEMFNLCCALLHASNIGFVESGPDASELDPSCTSLRSALSLFGVSVVGLEGALCRAAIEARGETLYKNLSVPKAFKALEALMKATYSAMFDYIVRRVNESITVPHSINDMSSNERTAFIGVLDIFGFESFDVNSFEQLCINFCNEALQQQFNRYVFKLEQEEYEREGIEWSFISFPDNQDVLDLIERKHTGILPILDEQCVFPRSTDETFARQVYEKCGSDERFEVSNTQKVNFAFTINHYAGRVAYDTSGFLEKNKDELPLAATDLLMASTNDFVAYLGEKLKNPDGRSSSPENFASSATARDFRTRSGKPKGKSKGKNSVGSQFSRQLRELRDRIDKTMPHYVRCLKPNDLLVPNEFNPLVIADQLRCAGVLEAIRVSRVGFPQRFVHDSFVERYKLLGSWEVNLWSKRKARIDLCESLVEDLSREVANCIEERGGSENTQGAIQMGRTKVFLRQVAFDTLELLRNRRMESAACKIQAVVRGYQARIWVQIKLWAILTIQSFVRRVAAHRRASSLRRERSTTMIQSQWRMYIAETTYFSILYIAEWCQRFHRGSVARRMAAYMLLHHQATRIQACWRRFNAESRFVVTLRLVLCLQTYIRSYFARKELSLLKREARDLSAVAAERDRFKEETLRLRRELEQTRVNGVPTHISISENDEVNSLRREVERLQTVLEDVSRGPPSVIDSFSAESAAKDAEIERLRQEVARLRSPNEVVQPRSSPNRGTPGNSRSQEIFRQKESPDTSASSGQKMRTPDPPSPPKKKGFLSPLSQFLRRTPTKEHQPEPVAARLLSPTKFLQGSSQSVTSASLLDGDDIETMNVSPMTKHIIKSSEMIGNSVSSEPHQGENSYRLEVHRFHTAVRQGEATVLESVIRSSRRVEEFVNEMDPNTGETPLHMAVRTSNVMTTSLLLQYEAVANCQDFDGNTPLHIASNAAMTALLLERGRANPNIPNASGVAPIHFAVQRRDADAVQHMLRAGANVNIADDTQWFTPLHIIAHPYPQIGYIEAPRPEEIIISSRARIVRLLCDTMKTSRTSEFMNAEDHDGNTPLHHAVTLSDDDTRDVLRLLLEHGANPNSLNNRGQTPLHLLCHNDLLREFDEFQEMLHNMLFHGGDANIPSGTGCTALHLALYHRDTDSAVQLMKSGAELHHLWAKPVRWESFWIDSGSDGVLALDMVQEEHDVHRILAAISKPQQMVAVRLVCMGCKKPLRKAEGKNCTHCGRYLCDTCTMPKKLPAPLFPKSFGVKEDSSVCKVCSKVLGNRKEEDTSLTQPTASFFDEEEAIQRSF